VVSGSGTFLFQAVIRAAFVKPFADRSALSICGVHWHLGFCLMGAPPQKHRLSPNRRRALELLANNPDGATKESLVLVHGIDRDTIAGLVRRLATSRNEIVGAGSETTRVTRYRITSAGGQLTPARFASARVSGMCSGLVFRGSSYPID
jgi:hypothetical protein